MELVHVALTSVGSIAALFLLTKLLGNKQMSQLNMFDYINGITIGSIAAEMATSLEDDFLKPLLAMVLYAGASLLITYLSGKSVKCRRFLSGKSIVLLENGRLYKKNFIRSKLELNEFLTECRVNGYFDLAQIQTALMEPNGRISILPKSRFRPVTPGDMNLSPQQETPVVTVILDGNILHRNLKATGNDQTWLKKQLQSQKIRRIEDVFLATCDGSNNLSVYIQQPDGPKNDPFQ